MAPGLRVLVPQWMSVSPACQLHDCCGHCNFKERMPSNTERFARHGTS